MNRVTLFGNLGADPDLRMTSGGTAVLNLRLATKESCKDKKTNSWQERTEWHNVVIWGQRAEVLAERLVKGSKILVEGANRTTSYEARDGSKRYKTEVVAEKVELGGGPVPQARPAQTNNYYSDEDYGPSPDDDDIPF